MEKELFEKDEIFPARYWHAVENDKIQCDLCPRHCKLHEGQRGLCFVRARHNNEMILTTYGRSSGFCIDPIEKKPLNHFYPGTSILSFGTAGCNLTCKFCQNHHISKAKKMDKLQNKASPALIAQAAKKTQCHSVAYTYNDPVIFAEYAIDIAHACQEESIYNVAVTAGYITEQARPDFFHAMDAVNLDIKAFSQKFYHELCTGHLENVLETAEFIHHETDAWLELTTLLIPDENDGEREIHELCQWVCEKLSKDVPIHFTAFHPDFKMMNKIRTPTETLLKAWKIAKEYDLHYVYTGNVHHAETSSTYCPQCRHMVIERGWHQLGKWGLGQGGHCVHCGYAIAGHFNHVPGTWGVKRRKVVFQ